MVLVISGTDRRHRTAAFMLEQAFTTVSDDEIEATVAPFDAVAQRVSIDAIEAATGLDFGELKSAAEF